MPNPNAPFEKSMILESSKEDALILLGVPLKLIVQNQRKASQLQLSLGNLLTVHAVLDSQSCS
jgi:hypothetical protein